MIRAEREGQAMSTADPNPVILTGENPFIRLAATTMGIPGS